MKKIYATLFIILAITTSNLFGQCMLYPVSLTKKVSNSALIIEGKVVSSKSFWNSDKNFIYTSNLIEVKQVIKGVSIAPFIEVITQGGEVDLRRISVEPSLQLNASETGVFMLNTAEQSNQYGYTAYSVYSDQQGFFKFNTIENSAEVPFEKYNDINQNLYTQLETLLGKQLIPHTNTVVNNNGPGKFGSSTINAAITSISPNILTAGTFCVVTINGSAFAPAQNATNYVEFPNADGTGFIQPHPSQYVSWSTTMIQVKVPTKAGTAGTAGTGAIRVVSVSSSTVSSPVLTIKHGEINAYNSSLGQIFNTQHVNINALGGLTWQLNTSFDANAAAKASFIRALNTWRCNTNINWTIGPAVATATNISDNINVVLFGATPAGVLGYCTYYSWGCTSGPNAYYYVNELDIIYDNVVTLWEYGPAAPAGGKYDFESVSLHELGHGHQLSHVIDVPDVMHYSITANTMKRLLNASNIAGGSNIMTRSTAGGVCSQNAMTYLNAAITCSISVPTASFNVPSPICVNQVITLTNISTASPTNFTWTMVGGTPSSANTQNASTSYATSGAKSITLLVSNGIGTSTLLTKNFTVLASPTIAVNTAPAICAGSSAVLTGSGSSTSYTWTPGNLIGATQTFTPANTTVYTVVGSNGTCTNSANSTIVVNPSPNLSVSNGVICAGSTTMLTAGGAFNYTWMPGNLIGSTQTLGPAANTTYTITGDISGCTNTKTVSIIVDPCTSLLDKGSEMTLNIFPNPTKGNISIKTSGLFTGEINIVNALGQVVITKHIDTKNSFEVDLAEQANGIYILKLRSESGVEKVMKLIKE